MEALMKVQGVTVEVRLWASNPENHLVRIPVAELGVLSTNHPESEDGEPVLIVRGEAYGPATEEAFASVLLVLEEPTDEETELLRTAAAAGYAIEPRVVGRPWRSIEDGSTFPLNPPIEPSRFMEG
jgi:hypothetical protein